MKHQLTPKAKEENKKFKTQLDNSYHGRMEDIRKLWDAYQDGVEKAMKDQE